MKRLILMLVVMLYMPLVYANSGQVIGPVHFMGAQDVDLDGAGGNPPVTDMAWLQINTGAASYDGDADNDTNEYSTECVQGYFLPLVFDISTSKGKAMYASANSAVLSGLDVAINYTQTGVDDICIVDDLFIGAP